MALTNRDRWELIIHHLSDEGFAKLLRDSWLGITVEKFMCDWCKTCGYRCREDVDCPSFKKYLNSEVCGNGESIKHEIESSPFDC